MAILKLFLTGTIWGFLLTTVVHCQLQCNFEDDTCRWYWSNGWIRSQGKASNLDTGPADDRTNPDGFYLHLNLNDYRRNEKAYIFSPAILDVKKKYCLSFFYLMHGKDVATLSVHGVNFSSSTEVWATSFEHGPEWLHQEISIGNASQVIFEVVIGGELGDIAIDDIEMIEGGCLVEAGHEQPSPEAVLPFKCTFEKKSMCGFENFAFNWDDWEFGSGSAAVNENSPRTDHTLQTSKGTYLHFTMHNSILGDYGSASLASPHFKTRKGACIQFWYNMYGPGVYKISVDIDYTERWLMKRSQGYGWKSAFIYVRGPKEFKITFTAESLGSKRGVMAIDDISIQEGKCPQSVDCSFENTLCAWSNSGKDDTDWLTRTGKQPPGTLGPSADHTFGTEKGSYLILVSKAPLREDERARYVSTTFMKTVKAQCLEFWYSMAGKNVGELRVFIYTQSTYSLRWKLVGPQTGKWEYASLPIDARPSNFWIVIEGVIGKPSDAYIAIDDISLVEGTCKNSPNKATIGWKKVTTAIPIKSTTLTTVNPSKLILSCHFNKDFCDWQQGKNDKADWVWTHLATPSVLTGPNRDHTTGDGGYIYVESSDGIVGPIRLFSKTISPIHENMCLKFWYFMYGQDVDTLRVFISPGTHFDRDMNPHWKKSGSQQEKWLLGKIFFQMKQDFQIVFQATLNGDILGDIALDDISLTYGACNAGEEITTPKPGVTEKPIPIEQRNCDFESKNICGYEHAKGSPKYFWQRNSGGTSSDSTGPTVDHTTNSKEGHYMYIEGSNTKIGSVARMITPLYQDSTTVCLQFYYHMYGDGIGNLNINIMPGGRNNNTQTMYFTSGNHGNKWEVGRVTIDKLMAVKGYKIMFEATRGSSYRADIALDDISFSAGKCASLGDCNFEDSSCTWKNVKTDDFDWVLRSGKTPSPQTGPEFDHTLGNKKGHYMYIETSPPTKPGMKAQLASTLLPKIDKNMCLEFWYSMNGKTVDSLKVILQVTGYSETVLWHLQGNQGKDWLYARVPLTGTASTYTLFFEATKGAKYSGDIAIDDISFTENKCQILPNNAKVTASPHMTTTAPTTPSLRPGNIHCNFDKDLCGWKQDSKDGNQWHRKSGPDPTKDTGPPGDHTTGHDHYILLETSSNKTGSKARLISPDYTPDDTGVNCVSFWYFMYGADVDSLNVYLQYGLMLPTLSTWTAEGSKEERWLQGKFTFHSTREINIVFEAVAGVSNQGDIAIDDISISRGKCVDQNDYLYAKCDFETKDMCGFLKHKNDGWTWHNVNAPSKGLAPVWDHTLQSRSGHYLFLEGLTYRQTSITSTSTIHATSKSCIQFYFFMRGSSGRLTVYLNDGLKYIRIWKKNVYQSNSWQLASIDVYEKNYSLQFAGHVSRIRYGNMAIDDFSVLKGKCPPEGQCDFEQGTCLWKNSRNDDFDWIIKKAEDLPNSVNPRKDHTINQAGKGHFLYVSANNRPLHSKAMIETLDFNPYSKKCLHFWFNSYGRDPGTITVTLNAKHLSLILWQLSGSKNGKLPKNGLWNEARTRIPQTSNIFTIRIDVVVGTSGYIAIDDVVFDKARGCARKPPFSQPIITKPPPTIPSTTPKRIVSYSVSCYFTYDLCGWTQDKTDDIDWVRNKGSTPTYNTGPSSDHTTRLGYYIYIESSPPTKPGDVARLISPKITLRTKQKKCLTFWYNMYGETIGTLSLLLLINGKMSAPIWKRQKFQGHGWIKGTVHLEGAPSLQVVFEANSGNGYMGDIALDDIWLHDYTCNFFLFPYGYLDRGGILTHTTTHDDDHEMAESAWDTNMGQFLFHLDPDTPVDNTPLPSCDFEGTCNYKTVNRGSVIPWIITTPSDHPNITDHTYNTLSGEFMYVNMTGLAHKLARIVTPTIKSGQYCLEFFYQSIEGFNGYFAVHTVKHYLKTSVFFKSGSHIKDRWTIVEVNMKESTDFTVMFEIFSHQKIQGTIAVDDIVFKNGICSNPGSCDFESGHLCFWTNDPTSNVDWIVQNGPTRTPTTGPINDHTKKTKAGMYALLESSFPAKVGDRARLISQPLNNNNVQSCFHFWYYMKGKDVANLSVSIKSAKNIVTKYWQLSWHQGQSWYQGQIPLPAAKEDFQIVIEATVGGKYGDIAIDDLFVNENVCNLQPPKAQIYIPTSVPPVVITTTNAPIISGDKTFNCTFEKGICGWTQSTTDDFNWIRNRGYTPSRDTGPQGDHTTGRGYYMYLEGTKHHRYQKAELMYVESNVRPGLKCMNFWYSMRGSNVGTLNIYVITEVREQLPVWTKSGTQGPTWNLAKLEFNCTSTFKVLIEGVKHHKFVGDIAIDDISLLDGGCKEPYGDCDFETSDMCGYSNDDKVDFHWSLKSGKTESRFTGPTADHTYGTNQGHYMYIESSIPRKENDTARLISPIYKALPDEHCLQFYYNMYGADVGELNVKIRIHDSDNTTYDTDNFLQIAGEQGPSWKQAQMELPKLITENPYQLLFEGVIGKGYKGDIAIDDIVINSEPCEIGGDCDFELSRCSWVNAHHGDDFDWMIGSGATSTPETGPLADHTLGKPTGFYLFIDASAARAMGQKAWYVSRDFPPTFGQRRCLTFWYSMNGLGVGILRVVIKFDTGGNNTLWELNRDQGNDWQFGQAPIKSPTHYKIIFEAVRGPDDKGDIAIDDIIFTDFSCSVLPDIATARGGMQTLPTIKGTTPSTPLKQGLNCTFNMGVCGWTQDTTDDMDWVENKGETPEQGTGPRHDHSPDGRGFYFYLDTTKSRYRGIAARLVSPLMRPNGLQCFTVWYHMHGSDIGSFRVYVFTGPSLPKPAFRRYGTKADKWLRADIQFNTESPYNIILEAKSGSGVKGNIAVDDVSLIDGYCESQSVGDEFLCTFEKNECGFIQDTDDDFDWQDSSHLYHSMLSDHTYGTRSGHFLYASSSALRKPDQYASISTPVLNFNSTDVCVEFWYHMSGVGVGTLRVSYLTDKDNFKSPVSLWSREGPKGYRWLQGLIDIDLQKNNITEIQIKFYGIIGPEYWTIIGLDDIKISPSVCKRNRGDCNFENDMCNWANVGRDDFDWTIGSGFTTTPKTGPLKDHTRAIQGGSYLYIEPESTNVKRFAILESETFDQSQEQCFQFYYFMKEATDGGLDVLVKPEGNGTMNSIWHLEGHQSGNWTLAQMHLPPVATTYKVIIRGFRGPRFEGQIAIDDVHFSKEFPCKTLPPKADIIVPTTTTPVPTTPAPIDGFDCSFAKDFCGWHHDRSTYVRWIRKTGKNTKPASDHTGDGFYISLDSSNLIFHNHAAIYSPDFSLSTQRCLSFYYYMSGEDRNILSVAVRSVYGLETLWKRIGPQGDKWVHANIDLPLISSSASIKILALGPIIGYIGIIALDDISLLPGKCPEPENRTEIDCDFEDSQCGYTQEKEDDFDWSYVSGRNVPKEIDQRADHTYGTLFGHYMYLNSSGRRVGEKAILRTPGFLKSHGLCLTFWYRMSGDDIGSLEIKFTPIKNSRYTPPTIWMRRGHQSDDWIQEYVPITIHYHLYVLFIGVAGKKAGGIAIDDVKLLPSCFEPGDCTFEINTCGWFNDKHDELDWQRLHLGHINFNRKFPASDHTNNGKSGYIMFFTSRYNTNSGKKADLISMSFDPTTEMGLCFEFWFIIDGKDFGSLTVFKLTNSTEREEMWHLSESKSKSWTRGTFRVKSSKPYQIGFRAVKGNGGDGYIAIDDIAYTAVICQVTPIDAIPPTVSTVSPSTTIPTTTHPTIPPSPFDCTFEDGFCKWMQDSDDSFDWSIGRGKTKSQYTGPVKDHTLGTTAGHFAFIESSYPQMPSDKARLVSPGMNYMGSMCLTFWYHMYGEHIRTLNVYIKHSAFKKFIIWSRTGTLNRRWYKGNINFYAISNTQIVFEGVRGQGYRGDIALDDIRITKGSCRENANDCDFENADMCNYKQSGSDDFDWSVGNSSASKSLPSVDHTYKTSAGQFMYVLGDHPYKSRARVLSPVRQSTLGTCVHFWYSLVGHIDLNIYSLAGGRLNLLKSYRNQTQNWQVGSVDIVTSSTWEVMFEAKVIYTLENSYIAIDDIKMKRQKCGMSGDCSFELDMCDWTNQENDDFDWVVKNGKTGSIGPQIDHTLQINTGSYLFIDGSSPQKAGDTAILKHVFISIHQQRSCLRFWYTMHGGTLEISLDKVGTLWRVKGGYAPDLRYIWEIAQVTLPDVRTYGTLIIKGIIGKTRNSYIAVDDISFHPLSCGRIPAKSNPNFTNPQTTQTPVTVTPSFIPNSTYDCAFEHGLCSWNQLKTDDFDWRRSRGSTRTMWTGPDNDHTTGTVFGWYIYIESSIPQKEGDRAVLVSQPFKNNTVYCFMFYYHMYGTTLGRLNVILTKENGTKVTIWTKSRSHDRKWIHEAFRVPRQSTSFTLSFEGVIGSGHFGDIAIDDVSAVEGECAETGPLNCTFESVHMCGYTAPAMNGSMWKKRTERKTSRLGPPTDHTLNTFDGSYMYLEWDTNDQKIAQAQLISPLINASTDFCMSFFHKTFPKTLGELNVYQQVGDTKDTPLRIRLKYSENGWVKAQVTLTALQSYKVVFEGIVKNFDGSLEIDDISTEPGLCPEPGNCDFEQDLCTWKNVEKAHVDWKYGNGDTQSENTGPSTDHTTFKQSGHYMYLEASYILRGSIAQLQSMAFSPTGARCMHFWYHMYGIEMGGLKIYFVDEASGNKTAIWYLSGNQGNKWQYAQVAFAWPEVNYVIIEGIRGSGYKSDMAIDDIVFIQDYCATMPTNAQTDYVFPKAVTTAAPSTSAPTRLDCDFETQCSWKNGENDDFKWKLHQGVTPTADTGPPFDHTLRTADGHYIYIETSFPRPVHAKAHFVSPSFIPTQNGCLRFWYFMYGEDVDTLTVYQKTGNKQTPIWIKSGNTDAFWHLGLVPVRSDNHTEIIFEGTGVEQSRWLGDIALDDISFSFNGCPSSADINCGFEESDMCGFTKSNNSDFDWEWYSPGNLHIRRQNDHTLGTAAGHYMMALGENRKYGDKAIIAVSQNNTSGISKCAEFWYYMSGGNPGTLNVYETTAESRLKVWSRSGNQGDAWSLGKATVEKSGAFKLEFEAVIDEQSAFFAIDDFATYHGDCPKPGNCDFEKGWCTWNNNHTDDFDWQIGTGYLGIYGAPRQDHTTDSVTGHFIFLEASFPIQEGGRAALVSQLFVGTFRKCMQFWYFIRETSTATLNMYIVTSEAKILSWTVSGNQQQETWFYARFPIPHEQQDFKIIIEGINGAGNRIDVAIDDISFSDELCFLFPDFATSVKPTATPTAIPTTTNPITTPVPGPFDCTFENGMCLWEQATDDTFDWLRSQGPMGSNISGLIKDHTSGTENGWYIYADSSPTAKPSDEARLIGPIIEGSKDRCLNFWYHMYGAYIGTLYVILSSNGHNMTVFEKHGDQGDAWVEAFINLPGASNMKYQVTFATKHTTHTNQLIALDDIRFTEEACHENNLNFCDFEDAAFCNYTQLPSDDFDWTWTSGRTPTLLTGPNSDHTMGSKYGHYMFIESSNMKPNKKAQIMSPKYNTTDTKCLHFYYYMYGDHVGELNVYTVNGMRFSEIATPIWSRKYNQGAKWVEGQTSIFPGSDYHIVFEGVTGNGKLSDIAIDDISLTNGPCQRPGFCDFEKDLCTWKNIERDQFDWIRGKGNTESPDTGPTSDHTFGTPNGHYIYIETSLPQTPGDVARLQSEDFLPSNLSMCLRFWYQMNGEDVNALNVLVQNENEKGQGYLWSQEGDNGPKWLSAQLTVDKTYTNKPYHLVFEGIRGKGHNGDIAIDDVDISIGECEIVPRYADPKKIALEKVACSFDDNTFCKWQLSRRDDFYWRIIKGPTETFRSGPQADHSGSGYYIYMKNDQRIKGNKAVVSSPILGPTTGKGNCFTFYYHMYGSEIGTVNIYTVIKRERTLRWTKSGDQGNKWTYAHFNINSKVNYKISIEGVSSGSYYEAIGIDDLGMDANPCPPSRECDFSLDLCGWTAQGKYQQWLLAVAPTPLADHTTGTTTGGFIYTNSTAEKKATVVSRVVTPSYPPASESCLKFWYYINGANPGELHLYLDLAGIEKKVWERNRIQGDIWWLAHVNVGKPVLQLTQPYKFVFESVQKSSPESNGIIAIDDVEHLPGPCSSNGVCDFEQDLCGFNNLKGDELDWIRDKALTTNFIEGRPKIDHTIQTGEGHYVYVEGVNFFKKKTAWLASWVQEATSGRCVKFWYSIRGRGIGKLNVLLWGPEGRSIIWTRIGNNGNAWLDASITLQSSDPFSVVFEVEVGPKYKSAVSIDDISFVDGLCETQTTPSSMITQPPTPDSMLQCNFERNLCGWEQDTTDNTDWIRTTGSSHTGGPEMDHTNDNNKGSYIMIKSSTVLANQTARLMSGVIYQEEPVCLTFWYHMNGRNPGTLNVYIKNMGEKKGPVWTKSGDQGTTWRYAEIEIAKPEKGNRIYFEGIRNLGYGDISLDDVALLLDNCPPRDFCDFEEPDICGYAQGDTDVFDWTWGRGGTPTYWTGPKYDHTYKTIFGHYMYIEVSSGSREDHAHLYSPVYPATTNERCLTFWYNMYGKNVAKLNVYLYQNNQFGDMIWSLQMNQGPNWHLATVALNSQTPFQVVFEGIRGNGVDGDIAIDDVKISKESCDPVAFCTFEQSICGWENLYDINRADIAWQRTKASSVKTTQGPAVDHTIGKEAGYYMLLDAGLDKGDTARLSSQTIPLLPNNPKSYCFHFWYNVLGVKTGQLNVNINYHGDIPQNVWSEISGNKSDESEWRHGMVLIEDPYSHFEIVLEGIASSSKNTYIALDDLQLLPGICPNMTESKFTCKSGKKISASKVCDFLHDCPDSDDEENCGDCTFENDICTWADVNNGAAFNWTRNQGRVNNQDAEIIVDHTKGTEAGWYVFANAYNARYGAKALLRNRALQQTSATCQMNFWYYISGHDIGSMALSVLEGGKLTKLWEVAHNHGNRWLETTADIGKISRPFKLQFAALGKFSDNGVMAIDDIEFKDCSFPDPKENCTSREFQCKHKGCVDKSRICDLSDDCGDRSDEVGCEKFTSCDFENSLCSWSQDKSDNFDWKRQSEETDTFFSGPSRDHSKGTASGYYIYAEGSQPQKKGDRARLLSPLIEPPGHKECWIRFFYHMRGFKIGSLNLYTRTTLLGPYNKVWSKQGHLGDVWERADVKLFSVTYFQAVFEAVVDGDGDVALDDITLTPGCVLADSSIPVKNGTQIEPTPSPCGVGLFQCKNSKCILQSQVCDFTKHCKDGSDEDVCDGVHLRRRVPHYLFSTLKTGSFQCRLRFWKQPEVARSHVWLFPKLKTPLKGSRFESREEIMRNATAEMNSIPKEDFQRRCFQRWKGRWGTCDFEQLDICGWTIRSTGRFTWQSHQGRSPGKFGPLKDHTTNSDTGKYMMVLGAYGVYKTRAYLETRPLGATEATCQVEFYVYMEGPGVGEISLNIIDPVTRLLKIKVSTVTGNQGANWKRIVGKIGAQPAGFVLQFEALPNARKLVYGRKTDMAIDDVKLLNCGPKPVSTITPTPSGISKPVTPKPVTTPSGISKPVTPKPVTTPSGISKPVTPKPVTTPSGISKPVTPKPVTTPSGISKPVTTPSGISKPVTPTPKGISKAGTPAPTPTPKGPKVCKKDSFSCPTANHLCFPLAFRCDGHTDCPDSYDEEHCGTCPNGQTYCIPKKQCISLRRCDGVADCPDGSDESACKECENDFCLNGGTCAMINGSAKCQCKEEDTNFRCAVIMRLPQKVKDKKVEKITLGVFLTLISIAIIVGILYILWNRRRRQYSPEPMEEHDGVHNPAYDYGLNLPAELTLTDDLEPPNFHENGWNNDKENSFVNPLYAQ